MTSDMQPIKILIAAMGGEGGGVLSDWIVGAATKAGLPVQMTSIPGVAQRTGATTYYLEIVPQADVDETRAPVMALYPSPGNVDIMVASELLEAGRAMELGYVSPDRTTLIASTHRVYTIAEKSAMSDGIYDGERVLTAGPKMAKRAVLADFGGLARDNGTVINTVLLGAIAGSGVLPIDPGRFEDAIRERKVAVEASLNGFRLGIAAARGEVAEAAAREEARPVQRAVTTADLDAVIAAKFPEPVHVMLREGVRRLTDYQNTGYADLYLARLQPVLAADRAQRGERHDFDVTRETARYLAVWMAYEDVIRVADLKSRASRYQRVRDEVGAKGGEPVKVTEFMKPGVEELCSILPPALARRILAWADRSERRRGYHVPMRVKTHTVWGFLRLWMLARLRFWRPRSFRYGEEQALIERWLEAVKGAVALDRGFALEVVECANLNKGYGDTHARGRGNFLTVMDRVVDPALAGTAAAASADVLARARQAALSDPEGDTLSKTLAELEQSGVPLGSDSQDVRPAAAE